MAVNSGTMATNASTATPLTAGACREVTIHNDDASIVVKVGNAGAQNYSLGAGQACHVQVSNRNQVYVKSASATPTVSWLST